jgi:hypothetical protein
VKTSATSTTRRRKIEHNHEADYSALLESVRATFFKIATADSRVLFRTDAAGLFDIYLNCLPKNQRQHHNCHACKKFIETYGGLVTIGPDGITIPVMWDRAQAPDLYQESFGEMSKRVKRARVVSPFWSKLTTWGSPVTGEWTHFSVVAPKSFVHQSGLLTAGQRMAAMKESFKNVSVALADVKPAVLDEVLRVFESNAVQGADRFIGPVKWLRDLQDRPKGKAGENMLWLAVATAPEGFLHPRASVVWPLVEAIEAGEGFASVKAKFDAMTEPLRYQRPQVAPSVGNVQQAEKIVAQLGIASALERSFARLEDLKTITWSPVPSKDVPVAESVFGHLKTKESVKETVRPLDLPAQTVTLEKFIRTVLPVAEQIEMRVPEVGGFTAFTTAAIDDALPILKWDKAEERNPVAWYTYPGGSTARHWGLSAGLVTVTAIVPFPTNAKMPFLHQGYLFVLKGCVDSNTSSGNGLFPECLNQELFAVRSTIEAYSRGKELQGREMASVCGWDMRKGGHCAAHVRVLSDGHWNEYHIDRWD